jgi:tRNA (guanosine-2'-O-)-methyltransferase
MNKSLTLDDQVKVRDYLSGFVTPRRFELFRQVASNRTRYMSMVLENIYQSHNASAVMRSCDCFGVQDIHIIEDENAYEVNPEIALGSSQWLTLQRYLNPLTATSDCIQSLKRQGYRIVATTPRQSVQSMENFDVTAGKFALVFGTEKDGLSEAAFNMADELIRIPMYGFTESFNISVSAALCLFHFTSEIRKREVEWRLTEKEILELELNWLRTSIKGSVHIEAEFLKSL